MQQNLLPINELLQLENGTTKEYDFKIAVDSLPVEFKDLEIEELPLTLVRIPDGVVAIVRAEQFRAKLQCDRCLKPVESELEFYPMEQQFYLPGTDPEDIPDDASMIEAKHYTIDLSEVILTALSLAMPDKVLCSEDCTGLGSISENEARGESPFAQLKDFFE